MAHRPNIVVIMADDLDVNSLDVMIEAGLMPNLEKYIIEEGITFKNSFVTNSICFPSRATFLSGQYSHNHGTLTNVMKGFDFSQPPGGVGVFNDESTIATWLQDAGYRTGYVGKYLNGYGIKSEPEIESSDSSESYTKISFYPDKEIFEFDKEERIYNPSTISNKMRELAFLTPQARVELHDKIADTKEEFY